jgi:hypothetical protein
MRSRVSAQRHSEVLRNQLPWAIAAAPPGAVTVGQRSALRLSAPRQR